MILSEIQTSCYQRLGWGVSPQADVVARVLSFINDAVKEILTDPVIGPKLLRREVALTTVADSPFAALPQAATFIHGPLADRTNDRLVHEASVGWIRGQDPGRSFSTTTPTRYAVRSFSASIAAQPSAAGQLTVVSSAAGDTTQGAEGEVTVSSGYQRVISAVTLTGTTPANFGPTDSLQVNDFFLSAVPTGEVLLKDAATNVLARVGIGQYRAKYTLLELYPMPSAAFTLYAEVDLAILPMSRSTDECLVPDAFNEAIVDGVRRREFEKREKWSEATSCERAFNRRLAKFKVRIATKSGADGDAAFSHLGSYFPSGS